MRQNELPEGATLCGIGLASDKTNISTMSGNRESHPLLITLTNTTEEYRMKATNHAYQLLALLPIVEFADDRARIKSMLASRLYHDCISFVTNGLKEAARVGVVMVDPWGYNRKFYTPLCVKVVDTPEAKLDAGVMQNASHLTTAVHGQFGDSVPSPPRTAQVTYELLKSIEDREIHPDNLEEYCEEARLLHLNGVARLFHAGWPLSCPSVFLNSEPLHHWDRFTWDHVVKWCIQVVSAEEFDFRYRVLAHHTGYRAWPDGVSALKQVTGRDHREVQRYLIPVIAGSAPKDVISATRAILEFQYIGHAPVATEVSLQQMSASLAEFHLKKDSILEAEARRGRRQAIDNWEIPKLEMMHSATRFVRLNGVPRQWSAEVTEHEHIMVVKQPARASNNKGYEEQICRYLDRKEKCLKFDVACAIVEAEDRRAGQGQGLEEDFDLAELQTIGRLRRRRAEPVNYFVEAANLAAIRKPKRPLRIFDNGTCAFRLNVEEDQKLSVDMAAEVYHLPDLRSALADFLLKRHRGFITSIGGRRQSPQDAHLPFSFIQCWNTVRIQDREFHRRDRVLEGRLLSAIPPNDILPYGERDAAIFKLEEQASWPEPRLTGSSRLTPKRLLLIKILRAWNRSSVGHFCYRV